MSSKGLAVIILDGEVKCAQIAYEDTSPIYGGSNLIQFFKKSIRRDFLTRLNSCKLLNPEQAKAKISSLSLDTNKVETEIYSDDAKKLTKQYPGLSPWLGFNVFDTIQNSSLGLELLNSYEFAADSLNCNWAYVVDLDKGTFEVYEGFNSEPLTPEDRFYSLTASSQALKTAGAYYPVKLVKSYALDKLPSKELFQSDFRPKYKDDDWY